jgi:hypothetical protein
MRIRRKAIAVAKTGRDLRPLLALALAGLFFLAQALLAAHASSPVEDLKGHSVADCALCLAGGAIDDPSNAAPRLSAPVSRTEAAMLAIPAALLTEITVHAASPRAPPLA